MSSRLAGGGVPHGIPPPVVSSGDPLLDASSHSHSGWEQGGRVRLTRRLPAAGTEQMQRQDTPSQWVQ
eukprot:9360856-Pyramimonas_sp.AAC.1